MSQRNPEPTIEEIIAGLEKVRDEIVAAGRWEQGEWAITQVPPLPACKWQFCLGGAVAWEALPHKTRRGKEAAYMRLLKGQDLGVEKFLATNHLAREMMRALVLAILRKPGWKKSQPYTPTEVADLPGGELVEIVVEFNDFKPMYRAPDDQRKKTERSDVVAVLNSAIVFERRKLSA